MDETTIKLEARLAAIEHMIAHLSRAVTMLAGATPEMAAAARLRYVRSLETETFPELDPVESDLLAAEIRDAFDKLLQMMDEAEAARRD